MISTGGTSTLGLYDFKSALDDFGRVDYWSSKPSGYALNQRTMLTNGDVVQSIIDNNGTNPNVNMTGWLFAGIRFVSTVSEMLAIPNPKEGTIVLTKSYGVPNFSLKDPFRGGMCYIYDPTKSTLNYGGGILNGWVAQNMSLLTSYHFGAKGDGVSDDVIAIQNLIDFNLYILNQCDIYLGAGWFKTTKPIQASYGASYKTVNIYGSGRVYNGEYNLSGGTLIDCDFYNGMGINFQGLRGGKLKNLTIKGKNYNYVVLNKLGSATPLIPDTDVSAWIDPAILSNNPNASSRYAPYAGVTLDAYSGIKPTIAYPDISFPTYTGISAQYGKSTGSWLELEEVIILGFSVAYSNQPSDIAANGDFTTFKKVQMSQCQYGISMGNFESRNVGIKDCEMAQMHTLLTTCVHGKQTGKFGGTIDNLASGRCIQVFSFADTSYLNPTTFTNFYSELCWRLGEKSGNSSGESTVVFKSSTINFTAQNDNRGYPPMLVDGAVDHGMRLKLDDCLFTANKSVMCFPPYTKFDNFDNRTVLSNMSTIQTYEASATNATCGGVILPKFRTNTSGNTFRHRLHDTTSGIFYNSVFVDKKFSLTQRKYGIPIYLDSFLWENAGTDRVGVSGISLNDAVFPTLSGSYITKSNVGQMLSAVLVDRTLTLTLPADRSDATIKVYGGEVGDIILDNETMSVFFVSSRSGQVITAILQNNYKVVGGVYSYFKPISMVMGNFYFCNTRMYTPSRFLKCDSTIANAVLTNCGDASGNISWTSTEVLVGDYIVVDTQTDNFVNPVNAKINAIDTTAKTITLNTNALRSSVFKRLPLLIRGT